MEKMSIKTGRNLVLKVLVSFNDHKTTIQSVLMITEFCSVGGQLYFSFVNCPFTYFAYFSTEVFIFLPTNCRCFFYRLKD